MNVLSASQKLPPIHPGEILLEEFMLPYGLSQSKLALELRIPLQRLHDVVKGKRGISLDTAVRLAYFFGTTPKMWINLQTRYELELAEDSGLFEHIAHDIHPLLQNPMEQQSS